MREHDQPVRTADGTAGSVYGSVPSVLRTDTGSVKEQVRPDAITRIKSSLVLEQIAKEENIEITDADVDAEIEKMAAMYNMEADKLKEYMGEDEKENMKQDLAVQKAVELITESVKPRAKAKTKKEKEAEAETEAAE